MIFQLIEGNLEDVFIELNKKLDFIKKKYRYGLIVGSDQ